MNEKDFEKYCFLRLHSVDMDTARHTLKMLKRYRKNDIKVVMLRDIAVTYARPFVSNKGIHIPKHTLSEKQHVPKTLKHVHKRLLELRNSQLAHTDISFHKPKVMRWKGDKYDTYPISLKSFDYLGLLRQINEIENLINAVEASLCDEIKSCESQF